MEIARRERRLRRRLERRIADVLREDIGINPDATGAYAPLLEGEQPVTTARRAVGWLRAAASLPHLRRVLTTGRYSRSGRTWYGSASWQDLYQACSSPQRLERQIQRIRCKANRILRGWGIRCSWAALASSLIGRRYNQETGYASLFLRRPNRAALIAAADTLRRVFGLDPYVPTSRREALAVLASCRLHESPPRKDHQLRPEPVVYVSGLGQVRVVAECHGGRILATPTEAWLELPGFARPVQIPGYFGAPCAVSRQVSRFRAALRAAFWVNPSAISWLTLSDRLAISANQPPAQAVSQSSVRFGQHFFVFDGDGEVRVLGDRAWVCGRFQYQSDNAQRVITIPGWCELHQLRAYDPRHCMWRAI